MIITKNSRITYKIEMTSEQADNLALFLERVESHHVEEIYISEGYGHVVADSVRETLLDLHEALKDR